MLAIDVVEIIGEAPPFVLQPRGELRQEHGRPRGVLVAHLRDHEEAVRFLDTDEEVLDRPGDLSELPGRLDRVHDFGDVLEPDSQVIDDLHAVEAADLREEGRRHHGRRGEGIRSRWLSVAAGGQQVLSEDETDLVACEEHPLIAARSDHADTIRIRIGSEDQIAADLLRVLGRALQRLADLRVGRSERHVREHAIALGLIGILKDVELRLLENRARGVKAGAVQWREDHLGRASARVARDPRVRLQVGAVASIGQPADQALVDRRLERSGLGPVRRLDDRRQLLVHRRNFLAAPVIVDLRAVVVGMVVRGAHVESALRLQVADREGELGCGDVCALTRIRHPHLDSISGVDAGGDLPKVLRGHPDEWIRPVSIVHAAQIVENADVVRDDDRQRIDSRELLLQKLCMPLDGGGDRERIDAIGAEPDRPASTAGAERNLPEVGVEDGTEVAGLDESGELRHRIRERGVLQPEPQTVQSSGLQLGRVVHRLEPLAGEREQFTRIRHRLIVRHSIFLMKAHGRPYVGEPHLPPCKPPRPDLVSCDDSLQPQDEKQSRNRRADKRTSKKEQRVVKRLPDADPSRLTEGATETFRYPLRQDASRPDLIQPTFLTRHLLRHPVSKDLPPSGTPED